MKKPMKSLLLSAAVTGMLGYAAPAFANQTNSSNNNTVTNNTAKILMAKAEKHSCKGQNSCKGQGGCASGDNGCRGKNSCKGKGGCNTQGTKFA